MPRRKNEFIGGGYYHVYNRGAGRQSIFLTDAHYRHCLRLVQRYRVRYAVTVIVYCLMPNHYHFLLRQDVDIPISRFVGALFNAYAQAFNREQRRTGTLFEGRFKHVAVTEDLYLRHLCRYIHVNPMAAGLVATPEAWPYSNYQEWMGLRDGTLVDRRFIEQFWPTSADYRAFIAEPVTMPEGFVLADRLT